MKNRIYRMRPPLGNMGTIILAQWLNYQASRGYRLIDTTGSFDLFHFVKEGTIHVKYDISVGDVFLPSDEEEELYENRGWKFIGHYYLCNIFENENLNAPDIYTDASSEMLQFQEYRKEIGSTFLRIIMVTLITIINILPVLMMDKMSLFIIPLGVISIGSALFNTLLGWKYCHDIKNGRHVELKPGLFGFLSFTSLLQSVSIWIFILAAVLNILFGIHPN